MVYLTKGCLRKRKNTSEKEYKTTVHLQVKKKN